MSRCFPYPPPGYDVSLIESIKLQKGSEKVKEKTKKEKKRDKKEKRGKNHKESYNTQHELHKHKKRKHKEISCLEHKIDEISKINNDRTEQQLERSGLTEEHELPCTVQTSETSEGSHDSLKRRKVVTPNISYTSNGTKLRIKFSVPKQKDPEPQSLVRVEQKAPEPSRIISKPQKEPPAISDQPCFSGRVLETSFDREANKYMPCSTAGLLQSGTKESGQFINLILNWNPPPSQFESWDAGDEDWLFGASRRPSTASNKSQVSEGLPSFSNVGCTTSSLQPRACYLPEIDAYQLPYVIPF